jgi:quinol monooxygenase YgiN
MRRFRALRLVLLGLVVSTVFTLSICARASEAGNRSAAPGEAIHVVGRMAVSLSQQERVDFDQLTQILFKSTTELDRPTLYTCNEDINAPGTFVWDEVWSSKEALDKHLASEHFKSWWSWVEPHLSGKLLVQYVNQSSLKTL